MDQHEAWSGRQGVTRIAPQGDLEEYFNGLGHGWTAYVPPPNDKLIFLGWKDHGERHRRPVLDEEDEQVPVWRGHLHELNQFLGQQCIYLGCSDQRLKELITEARDEDRHHEDRIVNFGRVFLKRVFSYSLGEGGRLYGGWWQNMPSHIRRHIMIGEWLGIECDFSGMALRCLYASEGIDFPGDPYDIGLNYLGTSDPRRRIVKKYVNAILNDRSRRHRLSPEQLSMLGLSSDELLQRVTKLHARISHHFFTGVGLRMQYVDSQIAEKVMLKLMALGVVCLPIHDSFIVPAPHVGSLEAVMEESFREVTGKSAKLGWSVAPPTDRFCSRPMPQELWRNPELVMRQVAAEWDRSSLSRGYLASWMEQNWTLEDHRAASDEFDDLKQGSNRNLLAYHAFPLPLFLSGRG